MLIRRLKGILLKDGDLMSDSMSIRLDFRKALLNFNKVKAKKICMENINQYNNVNFIDKIMVPVLSEMGEQWQEGEVALSQVYMAGKICEELMKELLPDEESIEKEGKFNMAIATLEDHHMLGKRMVYSVLRASGYNLIDYGHGLKAEEIVKRVEEDNIRILFISTLMYPSALKIRELRNMIDNRNLHTKIIVGGAPFNFDPELWERVGAHGMGKCATDAIKIINEIKGA